MYNNISLLFSANCNMKCKYCDVNNSTVDLRVYNNELRENIENGNYYNNIINSLGHLKYELTDISLWGLEPTINIDLFDKIIIPLLDYYENCNNLMLSTNAFLGYGSMEKFIKALDAYKRPIKLALQFSLDGPTWINDASRRKGATERTIKMIEETIIKSQDLTNCTLELSLKPTLDCHFMDLLNQDEEKFQDYFKFFYDLTQHYAEINHNCHIQGPAMPSPTLVIPHYHTVNDGYIFRDFIKNCRKYDNGQYGVPFFRQLLDRLNNNLNGDIDYNLCSSGLYTVSLDYKGNVYGCHNLYTEAYDSKGKKSVLDGHTSLTTSSKRDLQKKQLLIHRYVESREAFMDIICYGLAREGQIDPRYLKDYRLKRLLYILVNGMYCCYGQLDTTKSIWIPTTSYFKLLGNGAVEELVRYLHKLQYEIKEPAHERN